MKLQLIEESRYQILVIAEIGAAVEYIKASKDENHYQIGSKFYQVQLESKIGKGIEKDLRLVWLSQKDAFKLLMRQSQVWAVQNMVKRNRRKRRQLRIMPPNTACTRWVELVAASGSFQNLKGIPV